MVKSRAVIGDEKAFSLTDGPVPSSLTEERWMGQGMASNLGKRPDYYGLGLKVEAEKAKYLEWFNGKRREGVAAVCGAMESVLKLTDAAVSRMADVELSAVEEATSVVSKYNATLRHEYHIQDTEVLDAVEQTLRARLEELSNTQSKSSPQR